MHVRRRLLSVAVATCFVAGLGTVVPSASAETVPVAGSVVPAQDPFYAQPTNIGTYVPGQVIASRSYSANLFGGSSVVNAWQISYRTNDSHDQPVIGVTTLIVPKAAWYGSGSRPVVSVQLPEDATGSQCAPSYTIARGNDAQGFGIAGRLLSMGWAVAVPDFEGPGSHYTAGPLAGHTVLDGIRAVRNFGPGGIGASNKWALDGYSGGAQATGWAAELQPSYASEITLAGAAMGGTPADLAAVGRYLDGGMAAGFEFAAAWGISKEWPESGIDDILNDQGRANFAAVEGKCVGDILTSSSFKKLADGSTVADPLNHPPVKAVLDLNKLGKAAPSTPIYNYHAITDEIVPVGQADTLVSDWCAEGATVMKVRNPLGEHVMEAFVQTPAVIAWLTSRFNDVTPINTCGIY